MRRGKNLTSSEGIFRDYLMTVQQGTDSRPQRARRESILRNVLDGVFDHLDPNRRFNATQRRILWNASSKKKCSICGDEILRWEDVSIDHVEPYIRGGRTDLANAALTHKACNSGKGAR